MGDKFLSAKQQEFLSVTLSRVTSLLLPVADLRCQKGRSSVGY